MGRFEATAGSSAVSTAAYPARRGARPDDAACRGAAHEGWGEEGGLLGDADGVVAQRDALLQEGGTSCVDFAGYHTYAKQADGTRVAIAVIPRCRKSTLALLTYATSHELSEAATDPYLGAWNTLRDPYVLWSVPLHGAELGDLCENLVDAAYSESGVGVVTRLFSNAAMKAYKNPCLPAPSGASFFSNSFGQPSTYLYVGKRFPAMFGVPGSNLCGGSLKVVPSNDTLRIISPPPMKGGIASRCARFAINAPVPVGAKSLWPVST